MNKMKSFFIGIILVLGSSFSLSGQDLAPYIKITETQESIEQASKRITNALQQSSFEVLGSYHPANSSSLKVIAFTRNDLKNTVIKVEDRGALGAVFKVGFVAKEDKVTISYTNPEYILRAYLMDDYNAYKSVFDKFAADLKTSFSSVGNDFTPFGGTVEANKLKDYHYKIMMPYFTDPVTLMEFASFEEGVRVIGENLKANKSNTLQVYKLVYPNKKVAVFGVGLRSTEDGESYFLPKIGIEHAAALPYEIILQGNKATMLHGKYRIALHWPDLSMGTFMKIMGTPGDIEDTLEAVCTSPESGTP
jgi:hypothetical protein